MVSIELFAAPQGVPEKAGVVLSHKIVADLLMVW